VNTAPISQPPLNGSKHQGVLGKQLANIVFDWPESAKKSEQNMQNEQWYAVGPWNGPPKAFASR
jgi:hypothetical protein